MFKYGLGAGKLFSVKGQIVNILGFVHHVSVTTIVLAMQKQPQMILK